MEKKLTNKAHHIKHNSSHLISKKFLNTVLFDRREKELKSSFRRNKELLSPFATYRSPNKHSTKKLLENDSFMFPLLTTFSSFKPGSSKESTMYNTERTNTSNKQKFKSIFNDTKKCDNKTLYLTEAPIKKLAQRGSNKSCNYNSYFIPSIGNYDNILIDEIKIQKSKNKELLLEIEKKKEEETKKAPPEHTILKAIDFKRKQMSIKIPGRRDFINKTRELQLIKYTTDIQKERAVRLQETYLNKIESYQDKFNSLELAANLFSRNFIDRLTEYVKYIVTRKEKERNECSKLVKLIFKYKSEIANLIVKKNKIELDKNNIIRWLYFQISLKEKKLTLPNYYKLVIENEYVNSCSCGSSKNITRREHHDGTKRYKDFRRNATKRNIDQIKQFCNQNENDSQAQTIQSIPETRKSNVSDVILANYGITRQEYERVRSYKYNLIFKTPEEFQEKLISFENSNLNLINYKDSINTQLFELKKEYESVLSEKSELDSISTNHLLEKENLLNEIKKKYDNYMGIIENLKKSIIEEDAEREKYRKPKRKNTINNNSEVDLLEKYFKEKRLSSKLNDKSLLHLKIIALYNSCNSLKLQVKMNNNPKNKKIDTNEDEMLLMLTTVEYNVDYIFSRFRDYEKNNVSGQDYLKKLITDKEKSHKIDKANKQREQENYKTVKLREKIEDRNSKIFFLPKHKCSCYNFVHHQKKIIIKQKKRFSKSPQIEDFMHDIIEDSNYINTIPSEENNVSELNSD